MYTWNCRGICGDRMCVKLILGKLFEVTVGWVCEIIGHIDWGRDLAKLSRRSLRMRAVTNNCGV